MVQSGASELPHPDIINNSVSGFGVAENIGGRGTMEDSTLTVPRLYQSGFVSGEGSLFAVFDGHGIANGERASQFARSAFPNVIKNHAQPNADPKSQLEAAFVEIDNNMTADTALDDTGTTATVVIVEGNQLMVANAGDTEVVLDRSGSPVVLTEQHKAYLEQDRITQAGGEMARGRVKGSSGAYNAVGRSLGEKTLGKPFVIPNPAVQVIQLQPGDRRAIIACDGLWDVVNHQEALSLIAGISDPKVAAETLMKEANERFTSDNVSVIVIDFKQPTSPH